MAFGSQCVDQSIVDQWSGTRTRWITHRIWAIIFVFPKNISVVCVKTKDTFTAWNDSALKGVFRICSGLLSIHHKYFPSLNSRSRIARTNGGLPFGLKPTLRKFFNDAGF